MSLIVPPSHCPACKHRIRWFDNIPIVSWLVLRGRCRDCRGAISARYPLVEAITACMFALLMAAEYTFKGINLPVREIYEAGKFKLCRPEQCGAVRNIALSLVAFMHAPGRGIDRDRPQQTAAAPVYAGPGHRRNRPVDLAISAAGASLAGAGRLDKPGAGLHRGFGGGRISWLYSLAHTRIQNTPGGMAWGLLCVGVFLGWQAVCGVALVISLLGFAGRGSSANAGKGPSLCRFQLWLYTVTLGWISGMVARSSIW